MNREESLLDEPIFTVWLARRGPQDGVPGGQFTYGGLDTEHCGPIIAYEKLSSPTYFQFKVKENFIFTHLVTVLVTDWGDWSRKTDKKENF
ncbi:unnamed protein product [Strongylus vulgaris]|uniref:Peptidase A1 domain-containing protein n=1 Tax=Strongylus vulgaris TaxID=40348 RepID=A0A3P7M3H4_STRVU|nr:unnamed protein product [Strongylus vulgaris]